MFTSSVAASSLQYAEIAEISKIAEISEHPVLQVRILKDTHGEILRPGARIPTRGSDAAAGCDLYVPKTPSITSDISDMIKKIQALQMSTPEQTETMQESINVLSRLNERVQTDYSTVKAHSKLLVPLGIAVAVPTGYYGRIAPKSGVAAKTTLDIGAGVIDQDYRGEVGLIITNYGDHDQVIEHGKAYAQLILERIAITPIIEVTSLDSTERGTGGFGSTQSGIGPGSLHRAIGSCDCGACDD